MTTARMPASMGAPPAVLEAAVLQADNDLDRARALIALARSLQDDSLLPERVRDLAHEALDIAERQGHLPTQAWATLTLAENMNAMDPSPQVLALAHRAGELFEAAGDAQGVGYARRTLGGLYHQRGDRREAVECYLLPALEYAQGSADLTLLGRVSMTLGAAYDAMGLYDRSLDLTVQAYEAFKQCGRPRDLAGLANNIDTLHGNMGAYQDALGALEESRTLYNAIGNVKYECMVLNNMGVVWMRLNNAVRAEEVYRQAASLAYAHHLNKQLMDALSGQSKLHLDAGRNADAERLLLEAWEVSQRTENFQARWNVLGNLTLLRTRQGRHDLALDHAGMLLQLAEQSGSLSNLREAHADLARVFEHSGRPAEALPHLKACLEYESKLAREERERQLQGLRLKFETDRTRERAEESAREAERERERRGELEELVGKLRVADEGRAALFTQLAHQAEHDLATDLPNGCGLTHALGEVLSRARHSGQACAVALLEIEGFKALRAALGAEVLTASLKEAVRRARPALGARDLLARPAPDELALLLTSVQDAGRAMERVALVVEALRVPLQMGAHHIALEVRVGLAVYPFDGADEGALLRRAEVNLASTPSLPLRAPEAPELIPDTPTAEPGACSGSLLSARESEVLTLLAVGRSNKQMASDLGISARTVRFHVTSLFNKLGASNRTHAVSVAAGLGLLNMGGPTGHLARDPAPGSTKEGRGCWGKAGPGQGDPL